MPLSGCHVVVSEREQRHSLKVFDQRGRLLISAATSVIDKSVIQGSWRGAADDGSMWALAVGSSSSPESVTVIFMSTQEGDVTPPIEVTPSQQSGYWYTEAAAAADRVVVCVAGRPVAATKVDPLF
jgi:hypothetical protein